MRVLLATTCTPDDRKPTAAARALAASGVRTALVADRFWGQAGWSRSVERRFRCPHPQDGLRAYADAVLQAVEEFGADVILPLNDWTTWAVSRLRSRIGERAAVALPPETALETTRDKMRTIRLAQDLGVSTPRTWFARSAADLQRAAAETSYPCIVKLIRGAGAVGMVHAASPEDVLSFPIASDGCRVLHDRSACIVQEWLDGDIHDVNVLFREGEPRASLVYRRRLMYPPAGGVGVWVETVEPGGLRESAYRLLRALAWHGPAQVEFLVDRRGEAHLIEINGRFWGSVGAAIDAGIDFPTLTARLALDGDVEPVFDYETGRQFRWTFPLGMLATFRSGGRWRDYFRPSGGPLATDFRWRDPLPHLAEAAYGARRAWNRLAAPPPPPHRSAGFDHRSS